MHYLITERLYDHIKRETFQTRTSLCLSARRESNERGNGTVRSSCMRQCQCHGKLSHEVTKKVIKAALKLCMHVICYIWITFKNMSLKWFSKLSWSSPALSPSSNTPDSTHQLISRDFKTWNGSEKVKRVERKYDVCQICVMFSDIS